MARLRAREYSQEERERLAEKGHALPDGSFPIVDREDLENAIQAIGRAKDPDKAKAHIKKRARELGLEELIPEGWNNVTREEFLARVRRPLARVRQNQADDWYRIQNRTEKRPALYIYDEIGYFGQTAKGLADDLRELDVEELDVHINSPGGDIFDGLAIYQALKDHKANVTVRIDGLAASIASVIAMAGDKVVMAPKSSLMIHDGWTMAVGSAKDMRKTADLLDKQSDIIASVYADKTGQPAEFWREIMADDAWYNAEEALAAGLIDEIEGQEKKTEDEPFDLTVFAYAGRENAPAPRIKPLAAKVEEPPAAPVVEEPKKEEPAPFTWDFAAFKSALQEGVK
jgi:ATP-dependent Clp endopeptidase proteolytic subunit ClpP